MAYEIGGQKISFEASGDLSGDQFKFLELDSNGRVQLCGDGNHSVGVLQNQPGSLGEAATVQIDGVTKIHAGEALAVNDAVSSSAAGVAETTDTANDYVHGVCLEAVSNAAEFATLLLLLNGGQWNA